MRQAMIPIIRDLSPESRDLLRRQIAAHFPESGVAGLYSHKLRGRPARWRLEIHCGVTRQVSKLADFAQDMLLIEAMPLLIGQMNKCRAEWRRRGRAMRRAA